MENHHVGPVLTSFSNSGRGWLKLAIRIPLIIGSPSAHFPSNRIRLVRSVLNGVESKIGNVADRDQTAACVEFVGERLLGDFDG